MSNITYFNSHLSPIPPKKPQKRRHFFAQNPPRHIPIYTLPNNKKIARTPPGRFTTFCRTTLEWHSLPQLNKLSLGFESFQFFGHKVTKTKFLFHFN